MPEGLDVVLGDGARTLSGGQRQRLALARALAADTPVLALHDPTTAVDAVTEARIAARLREIRAGRTTILITTSPALLAITDRVLFVHEAVDQEHVGVADEAEHGVDTVTGQRMWTYLRSDSLGANVDEFGAQALPDVPR